MSKRLQVIIPDDDYKAIKKASRSSEKNIADWVRDSIKSSLRQQKPLSPEKKIAKILKYSKYSGPTGDIDELLNEIEKGKNDLC